MKEYKRTVLITSLVTLLPIIVGLILWTRLPEAVPIHFNAAGEADGYSSRAFALIGTPLIMLAIQLLCAWGTTKDNRAMMLNTKVINLILWIIPVTTWVVMIMILMKALNSAINVSTIVMIFVGLVFVVIGNYLPKCRQNYVIGIKLPTTLSSEDNWNRTHRLGGRVMVVAGLLQIILAIVCPNYYILLAIMSGAVLIPIIYSFVIAKK